MANTTPGGRPLGRIAPQPARPHLKLSAVLKPYLPVAPAVMDWQADSIVWPMYANDTVGDCTAAAVGHLVNQLTYYGTGSEVQPAVSDVLAMYSRVTGYNPKKPSTDVGAYCQDVLADLRKNGLAGHKAVAYAALDASNLAEVKLAIALFGSVYIGLNVPQSAEDAFDNGEVWDVVKHSPNLGGHCVIMGAYNSTLKRLGGVTWGAEFEMTEAFWQANVDEAWVVLDADGVDKLGAYFSGAGALYDLGQQFTALTGDPNPVPEPAPVVVPPPVDPPVVDPPPVGVYTAKDFVTAVRELVAAHPEL